MRVRVLKPHANPYGRGRPKRVGMIYNAPKAAAQSLINGGFVEKAKAEKKSGGKD